MRGTTATCAATRDKATNSDSGASRTRFDAPVASRNCPTEDYCSRHRSYLVCVQQICVEVRVIFDISRVFSRLSIQLLKLLSDLLPQVRAQPEDPIVCHDPVGASFLIASGSINETAAAIQLQASKDVLRPCNSAEVGRIALVTDVDITGSSCSSHTSLRTGTAGAISTGAATSAILLCAAFSPSPFLLLMVWEENSSAS